MSFKQWTTPDGKRFFPAGDVTKQLPPSYYTIRESMQGIFLEQQPTKSQKLIRFPDAATDKVISEIEKFWQMEESFRRSEIPYKRGMLMYGPPGSGKTCTIQMVIEDLVNNRNGMVVDFEDIHLFKEGYNLLRGIHPEMPLIVLMEDLEAILFRNPESQVLNLLDGMFGIDKTVFLATTNHPEKLGSRIMNRPSRFDKKIFVGMPSAEARKMFIKAKLLDEDENLIDRWVKDTNGMSIAHIHELFVANKILGDPYDQAVRVLKNMVRTPDSSSFDPYNRSIEENKEKYAKLGTGECYKEAKKKIGNVLAEDSILSPRKSSKTSLDEISLIAASVDDGDITESRVI